MHRLDIQRFQIGVLGKRSKRDYGSFYIAVSNACNEAQIFKVAAAKCEPRSNNHNNHLLDIHLEETVAEC